MLKITDANYQQQLPHNVVDLIQVKRDRLSSELEELKAQRAKLIHRGVQRNGWIDSYTKGGKKYAMWRSNELIFNGHRVKHIGPWGSTKHRKAQSRVARRNEVQKCDRRIREILANLRDMGVAT